MKGLNKSSCHLITVNELELVSREKIGDLNETFDT